MSSRLTPDDRFLIELFHRCKDRTEISIQKNHVYHKNQINHSSDNVRMRNRTILHFSAITLDWHCYGI